MNLVILAAVAVQWFVSTMNRLWGAIIGLLITLGIGIWGIGLYMDGYAVTFFGMTLSEGVFYLFIAAWIVYDVIQIGQVKKATTNILFAEDTNIYSDTDVSSPILRTALKGESIVLHPAVKNVKGTQWMQVKTPDGTKQFILGDTPILKRFNLSQKVTRIYAEPDENSEVLEVIEGQQQIELGRTVKIGMKQWVKVSTRQTPEGYIPGNTQGKVVS